MSWRCRLRGRASRHALSAATALCGLLAVGCSASGATSRAAPAASPQAWSRLVRLADLPPCPPSVDAPPVRDGLPAVTLTCLGGGPAVHLAGLRGIPAVVNVWASWCEPCRREAPALRSLSARSNGRLRVLGVLTDDDEGGGLLGSRELGLRYPSVLDDQAVVRRHYRFLGPPATFFVDAGGHVVHRVLGALPADQAKVDALVARYLGVRP